MNRHTADQPEPTPQRRITSAAPSLLQRSRAVVPSEPTLDVNKLPKFFRSDDPYRLNPSVVQLQRSALIQEMGPLTLPSLQRFVHVLFSDDLVVESYFRPKVLNGRVVRGFEEGRRYVEVYPWREAKRAATKASLATFLDAYEAEREFVQVAAWALPVGIFLLSHPSVTAQGEQLHNLVQARETTAHIARDAIKAMHAISASQSQVMNALIGQGGDEGCGPRQLSRLVTALYLSQSHIHEQWMPVLGGFNTGRENNRRPNLGY